jgi:prepilin-type N-terminal cleavage/methylation domain-containing protein
LTKIYDFIKINGGKIMKLNKRGVTLIELVVVFVIIAIGAVLMVPNMGAWLPNYRLRSATRDMVSTMRVAQMSAVSNNTNYQVLITGGSYTLQRDSLGLVWVSVGETKPLPTGITINSNTFPAMGTTPAGSSLFRPNSSSNGGTLVMGNTKGTQRTITVLPSTGRISIL